MQDALSTGSSRELAVLAAALASLLARDKDQEQLGRLEGETVETASAAAQQLEEALELLLSGATEVTEDEGGTAGEDTGL